MEQKTIYKALLQAQRAFKPALKQSTNSHFRSKYADLSAVVDAVIDGLNDAGIYLLQRTLESESGVAVETVFVHESGEQLSAGVLRVPAPKEDPHGYGSALTYARRYSLMTACAIAPESDDDGNAASGIGSRSSGSSALSAKPTKQLDKKQAPASGRATPTVYDISGLDGDKRAVAVTYLLANSAKQVDENVFKSPIRLEKLTTYIVAENGKETAV